MKWLKFFCYLTAIGELWRSLYFVFCTTVSLTEEITYYVLVSLLSSFLWVAIVMALFIGLLQHNMDFIKFWLFFAFIGFIVHDLFFLKCLLLGTFDWSESDGPVLLVLGTVFDGASIYLVNYYCKDCIVKASQLEGKELLIRKKRKHPKNGVSVKFSEEQELQSKKPNKKKKNKVTSKSNSKNHM